jgi:hypothetical protein
VTEIISARQNGPFDDPRPRRLLTYDFKEVIASMLAKRPFSSYKVH